MTHQPKALRLADELQYSRRPDDDEVARELRHLYMENRRFRNQVLEEAARLADEVGSRDRDCHAYDAAAAIRALKDQA